MNYGIGYIRVSTKNQAEDGISLALQVEKIKAYAFLNDIELVGIYGDPGLSGKTAIKRPGLQAVLSMAQRKRIQNMVVYKLDRFSRSTMDCLDMCAKLNESDVALHSICEKLDTKSALGRFFFTLIGALAELERALISERTTDALRKKMRDGEQVSSQAPFGFRHEDGRILDDEKEQEAIGVLRSLKAQNISIRQAAKELFEMGYEGRTGGQIGLATIHKIWKTA
jgi:DNA invertase Pin-like site-specific DNA recombinase